MPKPDFAISARLRRSLAPALAAAALLMVPAAAQASTLTMNGTQLEYTGAAATATTVYFTEIVDGDTYVRVETASDPVTGDLPENCSDASEGDETDIWCTGVERILATMLDLNDQVHAYGLETIPIEAHGGDGHDELYGGDGDDELYGGAGDDDLYGDSAGQGNPGNTQGGGADTLDGGPGEDWLAGGIKDDTLDGGADDDGVVGGPGNDTVSGGDGDDGYVAGGPGSDTVDGGAGDDGVFGDCGYDSCGGGADGKAVPPDGDDVVNGGDGDDSLGGDGGNDTMDGGAGDDQVYGEDGDDTMAGGDGVDALYGDVGDDAMDGGAGEDTLHGSDGNDTMGGGAGDDYLDGSVGDDAMDGGAGDDTLFGSDGNDTIEGGDDNDLMFGADGDDSLSGGAGSDRFNHLDFLGIIKLIAPDQGDDTYSGGEGIDYIEYPINYPYGNEQQGSKEEGLNDVIVTLDDKPGDGRDGVESDNVGSDVENVVTGVYLGFYFSKVPPPDATGAVTLVGSPGLNGLSGFFADDTIDGKDGNDFVWAGEGNDTLNGVDGFADRLDCGPGEADTATVDQFDQVSDCETVNRQEVANANDVPEDNPPTVTWVTPTPNKDIGTGKTTLEATATDDRGVTQVVFLARERVLCTDTAAPYTCEFTPTDADVGKLTLSAIAIDTGQQMAQALRTVSIPRFTPTITAKTKPKKDTKSPFRFRTTGKIGLPSGVGAANGCSGRITVQIKAGKRTISNRRSRVKPDCTFSSAVRFTLKRRFKAKRLRVVVAYQGNSVLLPRRAAVHTVRVR